MLMQSVVLTNYFTKQIWITLAKAHTHTRTWNIPNVSTKSQNLHKLPERPRDANFIPTHYSNWISNKAATKYSKNNIYIKNRKIRGRDRPLL